MGRCGDLGSLPGLTARLEIAGNVLKVELDPVARKEAPSKASYVKQFRPRDMRHWASK